MADKLPPTPPKGKQPRSVESYLRPDVVQQVQRLDLRARFIVEGFLSGLHGSPFQGFSVEFSEHRRYTPGDDIKDIDWNVYAKTEKYYVKKFKAETTMQGWLVVDSSASMGWTFRQEMTKFDYAVSLAAALAHLMIYQQDPVGLAICGKTIERLLPPRARRSHLPAMLSTLANLKPHGETDLNACLLQLAGVARGTSRPSRRVGKGAQRGAILTGWSSSWAGWSITRVSRYCLTRWRGPMPPW